MQKEGIFRKRSLFAETIFASDISVGKPRESETKKHGNGTHRAFGLTAFLPFSSWKSFQ